ncbi:MAG: heme-copper oxidase subunit III [Archangiaceae bacterium]|nr:heme-copper oxidase subunit III [Archangiaceae bacterium]
MGTAVAAAPVSSGPKRRPVVPSAMLGMLVFIVTEVMFFSGFVSAFTISKANAPMGMWPPPGQPMLPAAATLVNTLVLLVSGVLLFLAYRRFRAAQPSVALYTGAFVLGAAFLALQGREWVALLAQGMTLTSSTLGGFFFLIVGTHALHVVACIIAMGFGFLRLRRGTMSREYYLAMLAFWTFVVAAWPVIYARVYF